MVAAYPCETALVQRGLENGRPSAGGAADRARAEFEAMARAHYSGLRSFAMRLYAGDDTAADDLLHDCLERALVRFESFQPGTREFAWLARILHNAFIDRCRTRDAAMSREPLDDQHADPKHEDDEEEPPVWESVTREQFLAAVDDLEEDFRVVFRMYAFENRSYAEIAVALGLPPKTVSTRLFRARRKLRDALLRALGGAAENDANRATEERAR